MLKKTSAGDVKVIFVFVAGLCLFFGIFECDEVLLVTFIYVPWLQCMKETIPFAHTAQKKPPKPNFDFLVILLRS